VVDLVCAGPTEGVGEVTDDRDLKAEGKGDHARGNLKAAAEKVKDVFKS